MERNVHTWGETSLGRTVRGAKILTPFGQFNGLYMLLWQPFECLQSYITTFCHFLMNKLMTMMTMMMIVRLSVSSHTAQNGALKGYKTLIGNPMMEAELTGQRGRVATRSGRNVPEAEKNTSSIS